jgi:cyclin H
LATKTTNNPISIEAYTMRIPKTKPEDILELEFLIAQSLGFEFTVWHAHRALWGMWLDVQVGVIKSDAFCILKTKQTFPDPCPDQTHEVYEAALTRVRASRLTDAELIYTPSQIALASLSLASERLATAWSESKLPRKSTRGFTSYQGFTAVIGNIKAMIIDSGHAPDVESVREVDRRLRLCINPEKVVGSKAYLAKRAEEEKKATEKRMRKAVEAHNTDQADPFGNEVTNHSITMIDDDDDDDDDDD